MNILRTYFFIFDILNGNLKKNGKGPAIFSLNIWSIFSIRHQANDLSIEKVKMQWNSGQLNKIKQPKLNQNVEFSIICSNALAAPFCSFVNVNSCEPLFKSLVSSLIIKPLSGYSLPLNSTNGKVPSFERVKGEISTF